MDVKRFIIFFITIAQDIKRERWVLTDEAKKYVAEGSPEVQFLLAVPPEGISINELKVVNLIFTFYFS